MPDLDARFRLQQTAPRRVTVISGGRRGDQAHPGVVTDLRLFTGPGAGRGGAGRAAPRLRPRPRRKKGAGALSRRPMSAKGAAGQAACRRARRGRSPTLRRLADGAGLLDDERYAGMVVRHYAAKGYGAGRIRQELSRRGIPGSSGTRPSAQMPEPDDKLDQFDRRAV